MTDMEHFDLHMENEELSKELERLREENEALKAAMPGEPVAWLHEDFRNELSCYDQASAFPNDRSGGGFRFVPVYLAPPPPPDKAEIERLRERVKVLEEALEPFVCDEIWEGLNEGKPDDYYDTWPSFKMRVYRLARAALKGGGA